MSSCSVGVWAAGGERENAERRPVEARSKKSRGTESFSRALEKSPGARQKCDDCPGLESAIACPVSAPKRPFLWANPLKISNIECLASFLL